MIMVNGIQVLCGATAEEAANENAGQGFFTAALVEVLRAPHDPPLLALPLDLAAWFHALPVELLGPGVTILQDRDALVGPVSPLPPPPDEAPDPAGMQTRDALDEDTGPAPPPHQHARAE